MKNFFTVFAAVLFTATGVFAQQVPGAPRGVTSVKPFSADAGYKIPVKVPARHSTEGFVYATSTYTFADLVVFSYFDLSHFVLFNSSGAPIDSVDLNTNEFHVFSPGTGVYRVEGNNSFTVLIGDPITNSVMGFFAVDEAGRPLSTRLNSYMPPFDWGGELFIVFAYSNNTQFQIKNLATGATVASGVLNAGEHFASDSFLDTFVGVTADKPVSALSYADQGYFIPATSGTFFGDHFYGYSGYIGGWPNGIIITAYSDNTDYLVLNSTTGDTIASGTLNEGDATTDYVLSSTYWEVMTSNNVTVCNTPFAYYSGLYYYLARQIDESGRGIGTNFYAPVISGDVNIFSYEDNNSITVFDTWASSTVWSGILNKGEGQYLSSSKSVYHITGTKNLAVITSYGGGFGADFVPLNFAASLPDLSVSSDDIQFNPDPTTLNPGDPFTISGTVHNSGFATAHNVGVQFFDGDPSGGLSLGPIMYTDSIPAGSNFTFMQNWTIPTNTEYHAVYVQADPQNLVVESNNSNNEAHKFLIPNDDLLPPLSTTVVAPVSVTVNNGVPSFNQFDITVNVFNTGQVTANSAYVVLHLPPDLSLSVPGDSLQNLGDINAGDNASYTWTVHINNIPPGDAYFYSIDVDAANAPFKTVNRMLLINRPTAIGSDRSDGLLNTYRLKQNYPNPFNPATTIEYILPQQSHVRLEVYNIAGQKITTLVDRDKPAGIYQVTFDASTLVSGLYFVKMQAGEFNAVRKMMLVR